MMPKIDREKTQAAEFLDHRSYWNQNGHVYLHGKDVEIVRLRIYERDNGICQLRLPGCKGRADWDYGGEMHHIKGGLGLQRCSCDHNLQWVCFSCHRNSHVRVKWRTQTPVQKQS
jgi:hypothetical protein